MYANTVQLPMISNREDLLLPVQLFDDDLNQPINLSGTIGGGAFSHWIVNCGAVATTSATPLAIPQFPIGDQLSALALTVGAGLSIKPGDPVTIADAATGKNRMTGYVLSYAAASGALVVQIGVTFQFEIRRTGGAGANVGPDFGLGAGAPMLRAALGDGIFITDLGTIEIAIPARLVRQLDGGSYLCGLTMTDSINTRQLLLANLPVTRGGVR
jgi:hypothetical protein